VYKIQQFGHGNISEIGSELVTEKDMVLEQSYKEMLQPIIDLKISNPNVYWFIVSWLNTNYNTPVWKGYGTKEWKEKTKRRGIDCSGFARVIQDKIFNKKIRGSSQGILDTYCKRKDTLSLEMGDLLFFRAPYGKNNKIAHVGVFLKERYFVHATSKKSASDGNGLMISSLDDENWKNEFVAAGEIKY
jgi:cell wall-associated NlpC family hydrolase